MNEKQHDGSGEQPDEDREPPADELSPTESWERASADEEVRKEIEDLWERRAHGEAVDEEFENAAPELREKLKHALRMRKLIEEARNRAQDEKPLGGSSGEALRVRCPNCHARLQIMPDEDLSDLTCSSCGSHFGLADSEQQSARDMEAVKTLGHFDLIDVLGRGAFGTVWRAFDRELKRSVAVKIPRREGMDKDDVEMFFREARAAAQLQHPHIVTVHEVGRVEDTVYIVSELITGIPLDKRLQKQRVTPREAAQFCVLVAEALHAAHREGVIHRDLKPSNILIKQDEDDRLVPHITDFGLARRVGAEITITVDGRIIGTPAYMSPEQARGEGQKADARSDVYSLGVILFELCTGERPFRGDEQPLLVQVKNDPPPSPRKFNRNVSRDVETICLKCLEKTPEQRYQSAAELAVDLKRTLMGEPILARPIGRAARLWRWCRRKPLAATLAATVLLLFLVVTVGGLVYASVTTQAALTRASNKQLRAENLEAELDAQKAKANVALANQKTQTAEANEALAETEKLALAAEKDSAEKREKAAVSQSQLLRATLSDSPDFRQSEAVFRAQALLNTTPSQSRPLRVLHSEALQQSLVPVAISSRRVRTGPVVVSPDGKWLVSADETVKLIRVWRTSDWTQSFELEGHSIPRDRGGFWGTIRGVVFHPDDPSQLISAGLDGTVRVWSLVERKELRSYRVEDDGSKSGLMALAVSPRKNSAGSRDFVAGRRDGRLVWLDLATLKTVRPPVEAHNKQVTAVQFRPDGRQIASTGVDGFIRLWSDSGEPLETLEPPDRLGDDGPVALHGLKYSPDGSQLAVSGNTARIQIWNSEALKLDRTLFGHPAGPKGRKHVRVLTWVDDSRLLSGGQDGTLRLWNTETGDELRVLSGHVANMFANAFIRGLCVNPAQKNQVISSGADDTIRVWDLDTATNTFSLEGMITASSQNRPSIVPIPQRSVYSREKNLLLTAGPSYDAFIRAWDPSTLRETRTYTGLADTEWDRIHAIAIHPDGSRFVTAEPTGELIFWDTETGEQLHKTQAHTPEGRTGREPLPSVTALAWSQNGSRVLSTGPDHRFVLWNAETFEKVAEWSDADLDPESFGLKQIPPGLPDRVALFINNDQNLVTIGRDETIRIWNLESRLIESRLQEVETVTAVAPSTNGTHLATGASDGIVTIWDLKNGRPVRRISLRTLMLPGQLDKPLNVSLEWESFVGNLVLRKSPMIYGLVFSPDGTHLAVTQGDGSLSLIHIATGSIVARGIGSERAGAGWRYLDPHFTDSDLITVADDGSVQAWDLPAWKEGLTKLAGSAELKGGQGLVARPDGSGWAFAANDKSLTLWQKTQDNSPGQWSPEKDRVNSVAFIPDSHDLLVGTCFGVVRRVDPETGQETATLQQAQITREAIVAVSADGTLAAFSSADSDVTVLRFGDDQPLRTLKGTGQRVTAIAFRPDGKQLAVTDEIGHLRLWMIADANEPAIERVGPQFASGLDYSFDGRRLVQSGQVQASKTIVIWDPDTGQEVASLAGHLDVPIEKGIKSRTVYDADFSADGRWLATSGSDATVRLWRTVFDDDGTNDRYEQFAVLSTKELSTLLGDFSVRSRLYSIRENQAINDFSVVSSHTRSWLTSVAFSADSRELAVVGRRGSVRVFDVQTVLDASQKTPEELVKQTERVTRTRLDGDYIVPIERNRLVPVLP